MTATSPPRRRTPMTPLRKTALVAGGFYLLTFAASIPALFFLAPVLDDPNYVIGAGEDTRVLIGGVLDLLNAFGCVGTAVALFPLIKRQSEGLALGFVTARVLEAAIIAVGVIGIMSVLTLRQDFAAGTGLSTASTLASAQSLVAVRDWTFLLGPGLIAAINAMLLGTVMYRSRLVPRIIPTLGLIGGPLLLTSVFATMFGLHSQLSLTAVAAVAPIFVWELSLGAYMAFKGFRPSPITSTGTPAAPRQVPVPAA